MQTTESVLTPDLCAAIFSPSPTICCDEDGWNLNLTVSRASEKIVQAFLVLRLGKGGKGKRSAWVLSANYIKKYSLNNMAKIS
jgi:hypothetical protein